MREVLGLVMLCISISAVLIFAIYHIVVMVVRSGEMMEKRDQPTRTDWQPSPEFLEYVEHAKRTVHCLRKPYKIPLRSSRLT